MVDLNLSLQVKLLRLDFAGFGFFLRRLAFSHRRRRRRRRRCRRRRRFDDFMTTLSLDDVQTMLLSGASNKISKKFEKELQPSLTYQHSSDSHS